MGNNGYYGTYNARKEINYMNNQKRYFYEKNKFYRFKTITEERKNKIENLALLWSEDNNNISFKDKLYKIYIFLNEESKKLDKTIQLNDESYLFLIFAFDPELKLLQISFEESLMKNIYKRFKEEFGFTLDSVLLKLERAYNNRFPTIIDEFSITKK